MNHEKRRKRTQHKDVVDAPRKINPSTKCMSQCSKICTNSAWDRKRANMMCLAAFLTGNFMSRTTAHSVGLLLVIQEVAHGHVKIVARKQVWLLIQLPSIHQTAGLAAILFVRIRSIWACRATTLTVAVPLWRCHKHPALGLLQVSPSSQHGTTGTVTLT